MFKVHKARRSGSLRVYVIFQKITLIKQGLFLLYISVCSLRFLYA